MNSFWNKLPKPIVGLGAMDGVTDLAMREITKRYGNPDFMVTEFTSAEGVIRGIPRLLRDFSFTPNQHPIVAQIFGTDPEAFRLCAIICAFLGFDGIDLNMGCPAPSVAQKGAGAALIKNPSLAKKLILASKQGVKDYTDGIQIRELNLSPSLASLIEIQVDPKLARERKPIPISVKTRLGYEKPITHDWISHLLEVSPDLITVHGRTLIQQYGGKADWEEIAMAAALTSETETLILGNGDLDTPQTIEQRIKQSGVDGVWIGRAALGFPWIFSQTKDYFLNNPVIEVTSAQKISVALEHVNLFCQFNETLLSHDPIPFLNMRKHLGWYVKGFAHASELRQKLFQAQSKQDVEKILLAAEETQTNCPQM